jgi:hypothetical protein
LIDWCLAYPDQCTKITLCNRDQVCNAITKAVKYDWLIDWLIDWLMPTLAVFQLYCGVEKN